jgi:NCS1 family nucleobase:cation symporter-1
VVGNAVPTVVSYLALVGWETILVALASLAAQAILARLGVGGGKVSLAITFAIVARSRSRSACSGTPPSSSS